MHLKTILFEQAKTIGLREYQVQKSMLRREEKKVTTPYGEIRIKESFFNGKKVRIKPEFEDCKALALKHNCTIDEIEKTALSAVK